MKNITKRIIAVGALVCIAMTSATGCSSVKRHSSSEASESATAAEPMLEMPLEFIDPDEGSDNPLSEYAGDLDADDPVSQDTTQVVENATEYVKVTDDKGQPVTEVQQATQADGQQATEVQKMTEPDGQPATDENGEQRTQIVNATIVVEKTQVVNVTDDKGQIVTQVSNSTVTTAANNGYQPKQRSRYAMWLDISEDANFFFEGQFLKYTFKIKEGIPDGDYKVRITPDFSDVTGTSVYADKVIDGVIRVNNGSVDKVNVSSESGLVVYGDSVACKQGDTVDFYINIKNNSGLVAFVMKTYYDGNAMELISNSAAGDFEEISARKTDFGEANNNNN